MATKTGRESIASILTVGARAVTWYMQMLAEHVADAEEETGVAPVTKRMTKMGMTKMMTMMRKVVISKPAGVFQYKTCNAILFLLL